MVRLIGQASLLVALCFITAWVMPVLLVGDGVTRSQRHTETYVEWLFDVLDRRVFTE